VIAYFDTSALVKLFLRDEEGSRTAAAIWDASDIKFASRIAYPEGRAALGAAHRSRRLTAGALARAREELSSLFEELAVIELHASLAEAAGDVSERFGLRAIDSIHLASALVIADAPTLLVTWDEQLAGAGRRAGLDVAP
jgi:predicted nucleic acid-binding protein